MAKVTEMAAQLAQPFVEAAGCSLWDVEYDGVSGHIAFDETGDAIRDTAYIKTIDTAANVWKFVTQQKAS